MKSCFCIDIFHDLCPPYLNQIMIKKVPVSLFIKLMETFSKGYLLHFWSEALTRDFVIRMAESA